MKSLERFFTELSRNSCGAALSFARTKTLCTLHPDVLQAANRGFEIFPDPEIARLTGKPELLIGEATSNITRLEELAAEYPTCTWRAAVGSSGLCVVRLDGPEGRAWFVAKNEDQRDCLTLSAVRGEMVWAVFHWPKGLVLRASAKKLARGVRILADGDSFPVPPSSGSTWANPWAEIEAVPYWLRELAFEKPESPLGIAVSVPAPSPRSVPCRSPARLGMPHRGTRKRYSRRSQVGWRWGHHIYRCR